MGRTVDVQPPLGEQGYSRYSYCFAIIISALHLIATTIGNAQVAGCALMVIFCFFFITRVVTTAYFQALFETIFGAILYGYLVQLFGEIFGVWATSRPILSLTLLTLMSIEVKKSEVGNLTRSSLIGFASLSTILSVCWLSLLSLRTETLINFLGFGYDNAAHLAQTQLIINNHGTTLIEGGIQSAPTFLQDVAQAGTSSLATFAELTSTKSDLLFAFTLMTIAIPALLIFAIILCCLENRQSFISTAMVTAATLLIFGTGYLSHIWFSGYFGSNLGTLLLAMIAIAIVRRTFKNPIVYVCTVIITAHVYPLFLTIGFLLLIVPFANWIHKFRQDRVNALPLLRMPTTILAVALSVALLLPIQATNRSYGGSTFLVDGGIEYLPFRFLLIWGGLFFLLTSIVIARLGHQYEQLSLVLVSTIGSTLVCLYSQSELGRIAYYPTKIVIALTILSISSALAGKRFLNKAFRRTTMSAIALIAASTYIIFQPPQRLFTGAYMGEAKSTISSSMSVTPEVVEPTIVNMLSELSIRRKKPVLLISSKFESELNSRWINTISSQWNDISWSNWMSIRNLITDESWSATSDVVKNSNIIIGTDDKVLFSFLSDSIPKQICLIQTYTQCDFR